MSEIIPFNFETHAVRVQVDHDGQPWFNATDVCEALGFSNPRQALDSHVDTEDVQKLDTLTSGGRQLVSHINESGLYALIFGSTKDAAKRFKRWVTAEVMPSIRKTGSYAAAQQPLLRLPKGVDPALGNIRRDNLLTLIKQHGTMKGLARALGYRSHGSLSQWIHHEPMGRAAAKYIEHRLGLPSGWLDTPAGGTPVPRLEAPAPAVKQAFQVTKKPQTDAAALMFREMLRYLPVLERAEADPAAWERLTAGLGLATLNGYRHAVSRAFGEEPA